MMTTGHSVLNSASATLGQLALVVESFSDEAYASPGRLGSAIGQHVRHALDHFRTLLDSAPGVDPLAYDRRDRGVPVETDRSAAVAEIERLMGRLAEVGPVRLDAEVTVRAMIAGDGSEADLPSTFLRELWFVTHHAIHHNALIRTIAAEKGVSLADGFGRAPSTVNHDAIAAS